MTSTTTTNKQDCVSSKSKRRRNRSSALRQHLKSIENQTLFQQSPYVPGNPINVAKEYAERTPSVDPILEKNILQQETLPKEILSKPNVSLPLVTKEACMKLVQSRILEHCHGHLSYLDCDAIQSMPNVWFRKRFIREAWDDLVKNHHK